jgi:head-tail adaptor
MSFDDRLLHALVIERPMDGAVDDYNQPTQTWATLAAVAGLVQPKSAREAAQLNEAGAVLSTHTIYLRPTDLQASDRIVYGGTYYEITGIRDAAGLGHHYEVDARVVTA